MRSILLTCLGVFLFFSSVYLGMYLEYSLPLYEISFGKNVSIIDIIQDILSILVPIVSLLFAFIAYRRWKIDRLFQMHMNLRDQKYRYYEKNNPENKDEDIIEYAQDYLNELELIADLTLRKELDFDLVEEHFKTWYRLVEEEGWMDIINQGREKDEYAYRKLLELANKFGFKPYKK